MMPPRDAYAVWAPSVHSVRLIIDGEDEPIPMHPVEAGWWVADRTKKVGERYGFQVRHDGNGDWSMTVPDPRTVSQPDGVHGLSEVASTEFDWHDSGWRGRELAEQVIYELHVGTFTPEGTFAAIIDRLDYLIDLGVNTIELMPVQPFGGERNWGYDGVEWHAVQESYGGREGLKELIDAAHSRGVGIILDVVFNHFGPDGNYNGMFAPYTVPGHTGWGDAVNLSEGQSDGVRAYILDACRQWLDEFHVDGFRLDAVHAYDDRGAYSIMEQIKAVANEVKQASGATRVVIAESDLNDPRLIDDAAHGGYGLDGQWVDDIHHALHVLVSGENHAYYADFGSMAALEKTLREGFYFTDTYSSFRGRRHGRAIDREHIPAHRLVTYTTTHDQTGNRATGDRPSMNLTATQQVLKAAIVFLSPYTPMLFMGEEFAATTPFPFFVSHTDDELNRLTGEGRLREFSRSGWDSAQVPLPSDPATFESARLRWDFSDAQQRVHDAYRELLRLREERGVAKGNWEDLEVRTGGEENKWLIMGTGSTRLVANLSDKEVTVPLGGEVLFTFEDDYHITAGSEQTVLGPWQFAVLAV